MKLPIRSNRIERAQGSSSLIMRFSVVTGIALLAVAMVSMFVSHSLERSALLAELEKRNDACRRPAGAKRRLLHVHIQ